jgi:1-acyl-sn-glycerol-3-phosphate acyltransferase
LGLTKPRRLAIVAAYTVVFWGLLPTTLLAVARWLDAGFGWAPRPSPWGAPVLAAGATLLAAAIGALWRRGGGLPVSALPPPRLVRRGLYRHLRHPIYLGFNLALLGLGLALGSRALTLVVAPALLPVWVVYARIEERGLRRRFGEAYRRYERDVGLFPRFGLYRFAQGLVALRVIPVRAEGRHHVPRHGPAVIVANHVCYLDPFCIGGAILRPVHYMTTAEAYRPRVLGALMRRFVNVPVRRYRPDPGAWREALRLLGEGEIVGVFPEGERSALGEYRGALEDAAAILARLPVPVIPVGVSGSYDCGPRWAGILRRRPVGVRFGPPLDWSTGVPRAVVDDAIRALIARDPQPVRLAGLPRERLVRVLWRCPRCGDEAGWRAADLRCGACAATYQPTPDGFFATVDGRIASLADLGSAVRAMPEPGPLRARVQAFRERSPHGEIAPLEPIGEGELRLDPERLSFREITLPVSAIRSVTTERGDTLQVATGEEMWQFRPTSGSAFRLQTALDRWRQDRIIHEVVRASE